MNKKQKKIIANIIIITFILSGIAWIASLFIHIGGSYTDNAQVYRNIVDVSSRIQGFIKEIRFDEFQTVKKGDTLVLIEDTEYRLRVAQAQADYQKALINKSAMTTGIATIENNISVNESGIREIEILMQNAENDYKRYKTLFTNQAVTQKQYDDVFTKYQSLKAKLETMKRQKQSTNLSKKEQRQRLEQTDIHIETAKLALELAELNLSYTVILSPCDGTMSRKNIQEGELVMPGKKLFSVIDKEEVWVIANYRETQLKSIKENQTAEVRIDAYDIKLKGKVASVSNATGAKYSNSSPDNSVGNFVKVEQRIPIKIEFTKNNNEAVIERLVAGMNVECKILN